MNDKIYNWLKGFPGLEMLQRQQVDGVPGGCGLFFRGVTLSEKSHDLLGNPRCLKTFAYRLCRYGEPVESALFFLLLGQWAETNQQSLGSTATAALENARCVSDEGGLALWEADLRITCREEL